MSTPTNGLSNLSWKDPDVENSLIELRRYVESEAQKQIAWYYAKKNRKAQVSTVLRFAAIVLFVMGGLVPILKATIPPGSDSKASVRFRTSWVSPYRSGAGLRRIGSVLWILDGLDPQPQWRSKNHWKSTGWSGPET
jgi:hypothetical protein